MFDKIMVVATNQTSHVVTKVIGINFTICSHVVCDVIVIRLPTLQSDKINKLYKNKNKHIKYLD